jgi:hypothetical protein
MVNLTTATTYTNIYVQPFLKIDQRKKWTEFINNTAIFDPTQIYLANNPDFGVQSRIKLIIEFGIQKCNLADYVPALQTNFYRKQLTFGNVKVAAAKDIDGNYIYDAVYVDIIDSLQGVKSEVTINNTVYYPSSVDNMQNKLENILLPDSSTISIDVNRLPRFMSTRNYASASDYISVAVLCYTLPGAGAAFASRIRASKFDFKQLDFTVDRLVVENSLDNTTAKYLMFPHSVITDAGE